MYTYKIYMMTPKDHMSQDLSYFSGPKTSGAVNRIKDILKFSTPNFLCVL